jgi:hypothetical protein
MDRKKLAERLLPMEGPQWEQTKGQGAGAPGQPGGMVDDTDTVTKDDRKKQSGIFSMMVQQGEGRYDKGQHKGQA